MSRVYLPEAEGRTRRAARARRVRRMRRVRGCILAAVLMAALAVYAGSTAGRQAADRSRSGQTEKTSQTQQLQAPAASSGGLDPYGEAGFSTKEYPFTEEEFKGLVSGVLDGIVQDGMSQLEEARAVFDYVHGHISYTGQSEKSDWISGAYDGLTTGKGDCFTYYAVSRALLDALEIDNLPVERTGGESRHYWNLVNCGDGWYHFDACPRSSKLPPFLSFMFTDQQAADYTAKAGRNYYEFDGSLLPERAVETVMEN